MHNYRLIISCPDTVGIVARISTLIAQHHGWIVEADHHSDLDNNWFFMRYEIKVDSIEQNIDALKAGLAALAPKLNMDWQLIDGRVRKKVVLMASQTPHCLTEIIHRVEVDDLFCDLQAVISNHDNLRTFSEQHNTAYHHVPMTEDKHIAYESITALLDGYQPDVIVLARYMQIIPPVLCQQYAGRIINIHHSFLPSFIGANPYLQAYNRGVKLIGATCHYVTEELDAGPIISQEVTHVSHRDDKDDIVREGKDIEKLVLAKGLRYHLEDRVLIHGNKTVVFK